MGTYLVCCGCVGGLVPVRVEQCGEFGLEALGISPWFDAFWCGMRKSLHSVAGSGELWDGGGV
jgi:hypothetical protein